jgi:hypothetical protein
MAKRHWDGEFGGPLGSDGRREYEAQIARRRQIETQYLVNPYRAPRLIDEGLGMARKPRPAESLQWAKERLLEMGFEESMRKRTASYIKDYPLAVVYADPRHDDAIRFTIIPKPVMKDPPKHRQRSQPVGRYQIPDRWKIDLAPKLQAAVENSVKNLLPKPRLVK